MYLALDPDYPEVWRMGEIARLIADGGVGVIPTDTVYAFVCDVGNRKAIERLYAVKQMDPKKPTSIMCRDMSMVSTYVKPVHSTNFRAMRRSLPGPYTFILRASSQIPRLMLRKRRTIGVRIPDDEVCTALMEELDRPLLCSSVRTVDDSHWNQPVFIAERFGARLDFVVDGGERLVEPSTVVDLTGSEPEIIREGKGDIELFE